MFTTRQGESGMGKLKSIWRAIKALWHLIKKANPKRIIDFLKMLIAVIEAVIKWWSGRGRGGART